MRFLPRIYTIAFSAFFVSNLFSLCLADKNPSITLNQTEPDAQIVAFSQNNTGDCFFLATLLALTQDPDGRKKISSAFLKQANKEQWQITFPNLPELPVLVTEQEIEDYQLTDSPGHGSSAPAWGDPDVRMLEIAADKIWKKHIKPEGLWDDVPMNAVLMFSSAEQLLIWNRSKAANEYILDIDKYRRNQEGVIKEIEATSPAKAKELLQKIITTDIDGISMILIDYVNYHAVAITRIDFNKNTYSYIDTYSSARIEKQLDDLLLGISNGLYAINYLEID